MVSIMLGKWAEVIGGNEKRGMVWHREESGNVEGS
jgi:hypothetical protein